MDYLVKQLHYIRDSLNVVIVLAGQIIVGVTTLVEAIKYAKEFNTEKVGKTIITGIVLVILIACIPKILSNFS